MICAVDIRKRDFDQLNHKLKPVGARVRLLSKMAQDQAAQRKDEWSVLDEYLRNVKVPISMLLKHVEGTGQLDPNVFQQLKKTLYETHQYQPDQIVTADVVDRILDFGLANPQIADQVEKAFQVALQNVPEYLMRESTKNWIAEKISRRLIQKRMQLALQQNQQSRAASQTRRDNTSNQTPSDQGLSGGSSAATPQPSQTQPTQDQDILKRLVFLQSEQTADGITRTVYYDRDRNCFWIYLKTADGSEQWYWAKSGVPNPTQSGSIGLEQIEQSGNATLYRDNRGHYWMRDKEGQWHLFSEGMSNPNYDRYDPDKALEGLLRSDRDLAKTIGGYATLPALLAVLSSFFTDEPYIPILLGLTGLGIAHFYPEVREKINLANWLSALAGPGQSTIRDQTGTAQSRKVQRAVADQTGLAGIQGQNEQPAAAGQGQPPAVS